MEWSDGKSKFERTTPRKPPMLTVQTRLMKEVHQGFGVKCESVERKMVVVADTGCQTSSAGLDVLKTLGVKKRWLIPTCHRIIGITDTQLKIVGAVFLEFNHKGKSSRQMVYVSSNSAGLYLSETACRQLGMVSEEFPDNDESPNARSATLKTATDDEDEDCKCLPRTEPPQPPDKIPFAPVKENVGKFRKWFVDQFASSAFNTCSHQPLKVMTGEPMKISFKDEYQVHCVHTPIEVPHYWKRKVKAQIDRDVRLGIIEPVPQGEPCVWCTRMVVTAKKNGKPRRTVDLQKLKQATRRETHHTPTPFAIVSSTPSNTVKTVLDAWNGYHSLALDENAKNATTFITEWGRYRYCRAPQGYHASGDAYTRRFDDITANFERVSRCVDDSLLWDDDIEGAFWHTFEYISHCAKNGIVFNEEKFQFAQENVEFAGFELTTDGYRPPKKVLETIKNFPTPKSITDVRSWFGAVNQVSYAFSQSQTMAPFRDLLSTKNKKFFWDETLDKVFAESKVKIVNQIKDGVKSFEMGRPTCIATDWSKEGIGYALTQKYCSCAKDPELKTYTPNCGKGHWRLVLAGSRFTSDAESRYAPVEGEALAVAYALKQCRLFVVGSTELIVAVDHKPLTKILNDRSLDAIENPRILRLKEKTLPFNYKIIHVPGSTNSTADMMSRYPCKSTPVSLADDELMMDESATYTYAASHVTTNTNSFVVSWEDINKSSMVDEECCLLKEAVQSGMPANKNLLHEKIRKFWQMRDELYVIDHSIFRGKRVLVPAKLRKPVMEGLHAAHQGVSTMRLNARERFFWPGIDADLKLRREQCGTCIENAPSQPDEPLVLTKDPELPFEQVAVDFFVKEGVHYIVYADRLTGWVEVSKVSSTAFKVFEKNALRWFQTFGVPLEISSDGGPPFNSSEYDSFLLRWGIKKRLSSAHYPQSNGRAEAAVKSMKRCLSSCSANGSDTQVAKAIMLHRNTPNQDTKISPAEMLYGVKIRDHLPNKFRPVRVEWKQMQKIVEFRNAAKTKQMVESSQAKRELPTLKTGDRCSVQNQHGNHPKKWCNTGTVVEVLPNRQYRVMVDGSRRITLRNRKFLRKLDTPPVRQIVVPLDPNPVITIHDDAPHDNIGNNPLQRPKSKPPVAKKPAPVQSEPVPEPEPPAPKSPSPRQPIPDQPPDSEPPDQPEEPPATVAQQSPNASPVNDSRYPKRVRKPPKRLIEHC